MMLQASGRGRRLLAALLGHDLLSPAEGWERAHCTRPLDDGALRPCGQVPGAGTHDKPLAPQERRENKQPVCAAPRGVNVRFFE